MTEKELIAERDEALALADRHRIALLELAHACEELAARARAEIRVTGRKESKQ